MTDLITDSIILSTNLTSLKKTELKRIQGQEHGTKVSMVYLNMLQEAQNVVSFTANLLKVSPNFRWNKPYTISDFIFTFTEQSGYSKRMFGHVLRN